jgi:predicted nucleic acid-binding protein
VGPLILDASVLIGLLDAAESHHERAVDAVDQADRANQELLAPASAYGEALVAFARADRMRDAREAIAGMGIAVVPLTAPIAERAAELRAAHESLRLPDALVLATAREHDGKLLTYDDRLAVFLTSSPPLTIEHRSQLSADRRMRGGQ